MNVGAKRLEAQELGGSRLPPHNTQSKFILVRIFLGGLPFFSRSNFSWEDGDTLTQNSCKPSQDIKKLQCKEETYQFNGQRDLSLHTKRDSQTICYFC